MQMRIVIMVFCVILIYGCNKDVPTLGEYLAYNEKYEIYYCIREDGFESSVMDINIGKKEYLRGKWKRDVDFVEFSPAYGLNGRTSMKVLSSLSLIFADDGLYSPDIREYTLTYKNSCPHFDKNN